MACGGWAFGLVRGPDGRGVWNAERGCVYFWSRMRVVVRVRTVLTHTPHAPRGWGIPGRRVSKGRNINLKQELISACFHISIMIDGLLNGGLEHHIIYSGGSCDRKLAD